MHHDAELRSGFKVAHRPLIHYHLDFCWRIQIGGESEVARLALGNGVFTCERGWSALYGVDPAFAPFRSELQIIVTVCAFSGEDNVGVNEVKATRFNFNPKLGLLEILICLKFIGNFPVGNEDTFCNYRLVFVFHDNIIFNLNPSFFQGFDGGIIADDLEHLVV